MINGTSKSLLVLACPVAVIALVVTAAIFVVPMLQHRNLEATRIAILQTQHVCLPGTVERLERWGAAGYSRYCVKDNLRHGHFTAWEAGRKVIDGEFRDGNQHGTWIYLDGDKARARSNSAPERS